METPLAKKKKKNVLFDVGLFSYAFRFDLSDVCGRTRTSVNSNRMRNRSIKIQNVRSRREIRFARGVISRSTRADTIGTAGLSERARISSKTIRIQFDCSERSEEERTVFLFCRPTPFSRSRRAFGRRWHTTPRYVTKSCLESRGTRKRTKNPIKSSKFRTTFLLKAKKK